MLKLHCGSKHLINAHAVAWRAAIALSDVAPHDVGNYSIKLLVTINKMSFNCSDTVTDRRFNKLNDFLYFPIFQHKC